MLAVARRATAGCTRASGASVAGRRCPRRAAAAATARRAPRLLATRRDGAAPRHLRAGHAERVGVFSFSSAATGDAAVKAPTGDPNAWGADEVQRWFTTHEDGIWADYGPNFARLTGANMTALSEEAFLRFAESLNGRAIYNDWQALVNTLPTADVRAWIDVQAPKLHAFVEEWQPDSPLRGLFDDGGVDRVRACEGQFVDLPDLPALAVGAPASVDVDVTPKEIVAEPLLLAPDRVEALAELAHMGRSRDHDNQRGFVLSAGHGVGKSTVAYALVVATLINGGVVWYIPRCADWRDSDDHYKYMLDHFVVLNAHLLDSIGAKAWTARAIVDQAYASGTEDGFRHAVKRLRSILKAHATAPVLFLLDDHNELWKGEVRGGLPYLKEPFCGYLNWAGPTAGARTIFLLVGSAHSAFENRLPGGSLERLRHLRPLTAEGVRQVVQASSTSMSLSLDDDTYDAVKDELYYVTGGLPQALRRLRALVDPQREAQDSATAAVETALRALYDELLATTTGSLSSARVRSEGTFQKPTLPEFALDAVFNGANAIPSGIVFDSGIVYRTPFLNGADIFLMHDAARRAVAELARDVILDKAYNVMTYRAFGSWFEAAYVIAAELTAQRRKDVVIHKCGTKRSDTARLTLNYEVETWEVVDDWSRTAAVSPRRCTLFLGTNEPSPYIDFVVVDPRRDGKTLVMLYQVTNGTVYDHIKRGSGARVPADRREVGEVHLACLRDRDPTSRSAARPTTAPRGAVSIVEAMVRRATGVKDFEATFEYDEGKGKWSFNHNKEATLTVYYVYVSGEVASQNTKAEKLSIDNVYYMTREDLADKDLKNALKDASD